MLCNNYGPRHYLKNSYFTYLINNIDLLDISYNILIQYLDDGTALCTPECMREENCAGLGFRCPDCLNEECVEPECCDDTDCAVSVY